MVTFYLHFTDQNLRRSYISSQVENSLESITELSCSDGSRDTKILIPKKSPVHCWWPSRATEGKRGRYRPVATGERGAGHREARCRSRIPLESTSVLLLPASLPLSLCLGLAVSLCCCCVFGQKGCAAQVSPSSSPISPVFQPLASLVSAHAL